MDKGSVFERDEKLYEVLQDGLFFVKKNKRYCIRPKGTKRGITIEQALNQGLIRKADHRSEIPSHMKGELFTHAKRNVLTEPKDGEEISESIDTPYIAEEKSQIAAANIFYMPVDQLRAQVFLAHGLIYPGAYDKANSLSDFDDVQKFAPTALTLFASPRPVRKNNLLLQLKILPEEMGEYDSTSDILQLSMPLPISRIVSIDISPEAGDLNRYTNGWVKPDVPVPRHIFGKAESAPDGPNKEGPQESPQNGVRLKTEVVESIRKFDRYLGLMAFLRNSDRYFSGRMGYYSDYPEIFFSLCFLVIQEEITRFQSNPACVLLKSLLDLDVKLTPAVKIILSLVNSPDAYIDKEKARTTAKEIFHISSDNESLGSAFKALFAGDYRSAIQVLQQSHLPFEGALLAVLYKFSGRQSNDHRNVKQRLHEDWSSPDQVLQLLGTLGAYYGYTALDAKETSLYSVHPMIRPLVEERPSIKFHLETIFERQIIEAIYQWAFYSRVPDESTKNLYNKIPSCKPMKSMKPHGVFVRDRSYKVRDLLVNSYEVTSIGKIVQRLKDMKGYAIDDRSEVGRCLLYHCFFHADEYELSRKGGRETLRYSISKNRVIDLITEGRINVNFRVLEKAMNEDAKKTEQ